MTESTKIPKRLKDIALSTRDSFLLDPDAIVIDEGFNTRDFSLAENKAHLAALKESIRAAGILQPVTVRFSDGKAVLVDGETRVRAARELKSEGAEIQVPAMTENRGINEADRAASLVIRNSGKPLNALETGAVFQRLIGYGWDAKAIATKTGMSKTYVDGVLKLMESPVAVQKLVRDARVSASQAIASVKQHGGDKAATVLAKAVDKVKAAGKSKATKKDVDRAAGERRYKPAQVREMVTALESIADGAKGAATIAVSVLASVGARGDEGVLS